MNRLGNDRMAGEGRLKNAVMVCGALILFVLGVWLLIEPVQARGEKLVDNVNANGSARVVAVNANGSRNRGDKWQE